MSLSQADVFETCIFSLCLKQKENHRHLDLTKQ